MYSYLNNSVIGLQAIIICRSILCDSRHNDAIRNSLVVVILGLKKNINIKRRKKQLLNCMS